MFDPAWARAIASIESSGRYNLLGPTTASGDRAYGKYQVMGSNVGPWTQQHLGRAMTPEEFLNDPDAQDKVFEKQFGSTAEKYGSPQEAASVWFTGRPMAQGANARDILGTTGSGYVSMFNRAMGQPAPPVSAINAAMGNQPATPTGAAMANDTTPPPDDGFLGQLGNFVTGSNGGYGLGKRLGNAGVAMMSLDNAKGASALSQNLLFNQKQAAKTSPDFTYDPKSGTFYRTVNGQIQTTKNPNFTPDDGKGPKINDKVMKALGDNVEKYGAISSISDEGAKVLDDLQSGKLNLGAVSNAENSARNMTGTSNEASLAYARYKQFIQKLADTELLKAKGVQTEGDAYRVMQEIAAGGANFDNKAAQEGITKLLLRNKTAVTSHGRSIIDAYKGAYGEDNPAFAPITQQFDGFGKVYDNIDQMLERHKQAAQSSAAAAPAAGGFRVIKVHP